MKKKAILIGGFHEIIELCELCDVHIVGIIDNQIKGQYLGYEIIGSDHEAKDLYPRYSEIPIIISPDSPKVREILVKHYSGIGFHAMNLISPKATISKYVEIGEGVIIQNGVNISANVCIGNYVKLNTNSNIMHDTIIGELSTVAPNAVILGRVKISAHTYIGANSTILPDIQIGANAMIGAGAVVTKNVKEFSTVVGNPAKEMVRT